LLLIRTYQQSGFLNSNIDPLGLQPNEQTGNMFKEYLERVHLNYRNSGFVESDLDKDFLIYDPLYAVIKLNNYQITAK